ncbi:hypothetical protein AB0A95_00970 [Micromonospora sp. NPDC049230]|uniref:hypothetical protein n=1 Tax=Micromonospora sp. NPDC049230 TaxID=3155502 RepID=UPI0033FDDA58
MSGLTPLAALSTSSSKLEIMRSISLAHAKAWRMNFVFDRDLDPGTPAKTIESEQSCQNQLLPTPALMYSIASSRLSKDGIMS